MTPFGVQVSPHSARFPDMLDAAFNSVLPERLHDATVDHARAHVRPPFPLEGH